MDTAERPGDDSPLFVRQAEWKRLNLAAGLVRGQTVCDVGCGAQHLRQVLGPGYAYLGYDKGDALPLHTFYDTVVALEVIEHIDPAQQASALASWWAVTRQRLIISTPSPDAHRFYPMTDHFFGPDNPHHTRELHDWRLREMIHTQCCNHRQIVTIPAYLGPQDEVIWFGEQGPMAYYLIGVDK